MLVLDRYGMSKYLALKLRRSNNFFVCVAIGPKRWLSDLYWVNGTLNAHGFYIEILERMGIFPVLDLKFGDKGYIYQQDNAPAHSAATTKQYLNSKAVVMEWPPKSPDFSPIQQVWSYIKK